MKISLRSSVRLAALASFCVLASVRNASAQTACQSSSGPDVIAAAMNGPTNYAGESGIEAFSMGVSACNMGTGVLAYFANTNQHPVTAQNLYRLKTVDGASRFEQVGMSWLFHGFFALQNTTCCTGCTPSDGQHLGVRCSNPDTASINGSQSGLGPRWQVNAFTGTFPFPHANPAFAGTVARRLQVHTSDLEATGSPGAARYFGEMVLVAPDDAASGNGKNNASHRELNVSGSGDTWNFAFGAATTETEKAAIRAWRDSDPSVVETDVQVPGEGLFVLGQSVTDLGGGQWHYEFALFNLNSDRSASSFSIPIAAGVNVTNVGFHDVDYHSGDGPGDVDVDGTDWTPTLAGGSLTFATDDWTTNPSANALRWGTLYNFRFDADSPPKPGFVAIGLFKPGGPPSVSTLANVPSDGTPSLAYCFGDGSGAACPCSNNGSAGRGCENSVGTGGAQLTASGIASLSADTFQLTSAGELPSALSIVLQGTTAIAPTGFGDGLRCIGGALKRLRAENAVAGTMTYPDGAETPVHVQSASLGDPIPAGATRHYQVYYRDSNLSFCPEPVGSTFNVTQAVAVIWGS